MEHAGFRRLRSGVEPCGRGQIEPGVGYKVRVVQQQTTVIKHRLTELAVVEVVAELFGPAAVIFLPLTAPVPATGPLLGQAVSLLAVVVVVTAGAAVSAAQLPQVSQALPPLLNLLVATVVLWGTTGGLEFLAINQLQLTTDKVVTKLNL